MCGVNDILTAPIKVLLGGSGDDRVNTAPRDALDPSRQPLPDPNDSSAVQARLREKQRLQALAGYRSLFLSGPRGPGGPTLAQQSEQLNPAAPLPALPAPDPILDNPYSIPPAGTSGVSPGGGTGGVGGAQNEDWYLGGSGERRRRVRQ